MTTNMSAPDAPLATLKAREALWRKLRLRNRETVLIVTTAARGAGRSFEFVVNSPLVLFELFALP
jgi:hypothetical protein